MMKTIKIITVTIIALFLLQCATNQYTNQQKPSYMNIIDDKTEYFDTTKLGKIVNYSDGTYTYESTYDTLSDGTVIEYGGGAGHYTMQISPKKGWFRITKLFHKNRMIENKQLFTTGRFYSIGADVNNIGPEYHFDEQGKLIKTIDHDKDYKTSFDKIIEIATRYRDRYKLPVNVAMDEEIGGGTLLSNSVGITRQKGMLEGLWIVEFDVIHFENPDPTRNERLRLHIDDNTGKVIYEKHYFFFGIQRGIPLPDNEFEKVIGEKPLETSSIYRTYKGKNYTKSEWEAFERELFNDYAKKNNIKPDDDYIYDPFKPKDS